MNIKKKIANTFFKLLSLKNNSKIIFIFNFLFFLSLFDLSKADTNKLNISKPDQIKIEYLEPSNALEDYIVDTGDSLFIQFTNRPRGFAAIENNLDPNDIEYLDPRSDLNNYFLDSGDTIFLKFIYIPEFNAERQINQEGEIILPELGAVYVKGLNIYQLKNLLEKKYEKFVKLPSLETVSIPTTLLRHVGAGQTDIPETLYNQTEG